MDISFWNVYNFFVIEAEGFKFLSIGSNKGIFTVVRAVYVFQASFNTGTVNVRQIRRIFSQESAAEPRSNRQTGPSPVSGRHGCGYRETNACPHSSHSSLKAEMPDAQAIIRPLRSSLKNPICEWV